MEIGGRSDGISMTKSALAGDLTRLAVAIDDEEMVAGSVRKSA